MRKRAPRDDAPPALYGSIQPIGGVTGVAGAKSLRDLNPEVTPARITDLPWWKRKHEKRNRVGPAALAENAAKFKGGCKACHKGAEQGSFDDD
jgi:hypothetical protein